MSYEGLNFTNKGVLPPGNYQFTLDGLRNSIFVQGPNNPKIPEWDTFWRAHLVDQAELLITQLWDIGITEIFLDGSFVEAKPHPNDIDGYFECDLSEFASGHIERQLNQKDPFKIWTWDSTSRKSYHGYTKKQLPMWHKYRVEFYPHYGQNSGIKDVFGNDQIFPAAFRKSRTHGDQKGIVKIIKQETQ